MKIILIILLSLSNLFGGFADGFNRSFTISSQMQTNAAIARMNASMNEEKEKQRINQHYLGQIRLLSIKYEMILEDIINQKKK